STRLGNGLGRSNERMWHCYNHVPRADPRGHQRKAQRVGAAVNRDGMLRLAEFRKCFFEAINHRTTNKISSADRLVENLRQFFFKLDVRSYKIKKRDAGYAHFVTSEACSI